MTLVEEAKATLRITSDDEGLNAEINTLISAARADLESSGVAGYLACAPEPEGLVRSAILLYVKANFGYDNADADRLTEHYEAAKRHLTSADEFRESDAS